MWFLKGETVTHHTLIPLARPYVEDNWSGVSSSLRYRMKCSPLVGTGCLLSSAVQAPALPVRTPILTTNTLALELCGVTTQRPPTMWTNEIQDRRNVILTELRVS